MKRAEQCYHVAGFIADACCAALRTQTGVSARKDGLNFSIVTSHIIGGGTAVLGAVAWLFAAAHLPDHAWPCVRLVRTDNAYVDIPHASLARLVSEHTVVMNTVT